MPTHRIRARPPHASTETPVELITATDRVAEFLEDAAHYPGGPRTGGGLPAGRGPARVGTTGCRRRPADRRAVVADRRRHPAGRGGTEPVEADRHRRTGPDPHHAPARCHADEPPEHADGCRKGLSAGAHLRGRDHRGIVSTNAAGATTFKYGTTRDWVRGLSVMLACGELLDLERGQVRAADGRFAVETSNGTITVSGPDLSDARCAEALGRLSRGPRDGSDRPVHRVGGNPGNRDVGHAGHPAAAARKSVSSWSRSTTRPGPSGSPPGCATRRSRRDAPERVTGSTSSPSSTWTGGVSSCCARRGPIDGRG